MPLALVTMAGALVVTTAVVSVVLAGLGAEPASAADGPPAPAPTAGASVVIAEAGDSLWSIARDHRGEVSHDRYLEALIELNGGTTIDIGQAVWLP